MRVALVIEETQDRLRKLKETHAEMKMGFEGCSWEDLLWGVYQVESRVFTIYEDKPTVYEDLNRKDYSGGKVGMKYAVPLVDMFNHDSSSLHELKCTRDGFYKMIAGKKIVPGQEIAYPYGGGVLNNDRIFQDYGFVEAGNKNDVSQILLEKTDMPTLNGASGLGLDEEGIHTALASFSTTLEEDIELLPSLSGFSATAVRFRMEKKNAMRRALDVLKSKK